MDLGLDIEAYKDYLNNLKQFAHLNNDFMLFANDDMKISNIEHREMVTIIDPDSGKVTHKSGFADENELFDAKCKMVFNTLGKLRREAAAFLSKDDKNTMEEFFNNLREYIIGNIDIFEIVKVIYDKRNEQLAARQEH